MSDMVEVVIDSVRVSLMSPQRVVVLRQTDVERYLAIWVGPYEAESITVALAGSGNEPPVDPRPAQESFQHLQRQDPAHRDHRPER